MKGFLREFRRINWAGTLFGSKKRTAVTMFIGIPAVVGLASLGYQFYLQQNPAVVYFHKINSMTQKISKTVRLPTDEQPVIATVTDTNILPKEQFFAFAKDGDKIFMYKKHHLAILYRPSVGLVITKATLVFQDATSTPAHNKDITAVAGASTSAAISSTTEASPTPVSSSTDQNSRINTYHPDGKILVMPQ